MNAVLKPVTSEVVLVTPKVAADWLASNANNRAVKAAHVKRLSSAMARGEWVLNGETVKFDINGRLVDGQHRLKAVIESGVNVPLEVRYGVPVEAFVTIDSGVGRGASDVLYIQGHRGRPRDIAAAARIVFHGLRNALPAAFNSGRDAASVSQIVNIVAAHPALAEMVEDLKARGAQKVFPIGLGAGVFFLIHLAHPSDPRVKTFIDGVVSGENLSAKSPMYILRERMLDPASRGRHAVSIRVELAGFIVKAWNAYYTDKPLSVLRLFKNETFPEIA